MKIAKMNFYGGAREKVCRLGLAHLFLELQDILISTEIKVLNKKNGNGSAVVRELMDKNFKAFGGWIQQKTGGIDWTKKIRYNQSILS